MVGMKGQWDARTHGILITVTSKVTRHTDTVREESAHHQHLPLSPLLMAIIHFSNSKNIIKTIKLQLKKKIYTGKADSNKTP